MNNIDSNIHYYENYDWSEHGEEWSSPWGNTQGLWKATIFPRIRKFLPAKRIVDIGCGHGRLGHYLHHHTIEHLTLIDLMPDCVTQSTNRMKGLDNVSVRQTDGTTLTDVSDHSIDFIFSFYSLVGADIHTLDSYMAEISRCLTKDGVAFIHHSNARHYFDPTSTHQSRSMALLSTYRDSSVCSKTLATHAQEHGLTCFEQECVNWDVEQVLSDCFSTIARRGSIWDVGSICHQNLGFRKERALIREYLQRRSMTKNPRQSISSAQLPSSYRSVNCPA